MMAATQLSACGEYSTRLGWRQANIYDFLSPSPYNCDTLFDQLQAIQENSPFSRIQRSCREYTKKQKNISTKVLSRLAQPGFVTPWKRRE